MTSNDEPEAACQVAHVRDCGCRTTAEGKVIVDRRCLTPAQRALVNALIGAAKNAQHAIESAR
jgi:hypothetical protein